VQADPARIVAGSIATAAFFAPLILTSPESFCEPSINIFSNTFYPLQYRFIVIFHNRLYIIAIIPKFTKS
jgi:hypothetical protein